MTAGAVWAFVSPLLSLGSELALLAAFVLLLQRYRIIRRQNRALLKEKEVIYAFVHDVGEIFADTDVVEMEPLLEKVLFYALRTTRAGAGVIYMLDAANERLCARAVSGVFPPLVGASEEGLSQAVSKSQYLEATIRAQTIRKGEGLLGEIADFGNPVLVADAERDPRIPQGPEDYLRVRSLLAVPMRFRQRTMGVLVVVNPIDGQWFIQSDLNLLQALADQASVSAYYALLREELDEKRRLDHDLLVARRIQTMLLPREIPSIAGLEMAAFNVPAQQIGGDYYDFVRVDETHWGIAIADVSGKGISGAILMSVCRSVLRAKAPGCLSPSLVLKALNRVLSDDLAEDMFITAVYMVFDTETRELAIARAGHERPLLFSPREARVTPLDSPGVAIGMGDEEVFDATIRDSVVTLMPGDLVTLYTDGISEAMNEAGEEWGVERLTETIRGADGTPAKALLALIQQRLQRFAGSAPPSDDMTMVALRIGGDPSAPTA